MNIYLPHIGYVVKVVRITAVPDEIPNAAAWVKREDENMSIIHLPQDAPPPVILHEIIHVLWNICKDRHMDFLEEKEHMAYLAQYIMVEILP